LNKINHEIISIIVKWVAFCFVKGVIKEVFVDITNRGEINVTVQKGLSSLFCLGKARLNKGLCSKKLDFNKI
jgi:hypothetical protein